jgi:hypothetical protein
MLLVAWRTSRLAYEFDRDTARYRRRLVRFGVHLPMSGLGAVERTREHGKVFFCLYRWAERIHFQAGVRAWRLDQEGLRFEFRPLDGRTSEFSVLLQQQLVFRCSYQHWLRARRLRPDATLDSVDLERDHFLAHVAGQPLPVADVEAWEDGQALPLPAGGTGEAGDEEDPVPGS